LIDVDLETTGPDQSEPVAVGGDLAPGRSVTRIAVDRTERGKVGVIPDSVGGFDDYSAV
jgi:hypothetical protein